MRSFLETVQQRVTQIEDTVIGSRQSQCNQQNQEPGIFVDLLRTRISTLERQLFEKHRQLQKRKSKDCH